MHSPGWVTAPCSPEINYFVPQNQNLIFLYSLFPKIALVTLFPSFLDFCSLVPEDPWAALIIYAQAETVISSTEIRNMIQYPGLPGWLLFFQAAVFCPIHCTTFTRINLSEFCPLYCLRNKLQIKNKIKKCV